MSGDLRDQIYNELNLRETDDLLEIWHSNNHEEWSDTAFEVIKKILTERLGEIPPQDEVLEESQEGEDSKVDNKELDDGLEEWEAKALDDENQPEFYDTLEVITLKENIGKTLKAVIVVNILVGVTIFSWYRNLVASYFLNNMDYSSIINVIALFVTGLSIALQIAITYYPLKALMNILRILMEMEFRSRKAG